MISKTDAVNQLGAFQSAGTSPPTRKTTSLAGYPVSLTVERWGPESAGARPFYVVTKHTKKGLPQDRRYVPLVYGVLDDRRPTPEAQRRAEAEARALAIFEAFARDVTEPALLAKIGVCVSVEATEAIRAPRTSKRTLTPEHIAAMQAGRRKAKARVDA
jgi:hypothetical protein